MEQNLLNMFVDAIGIYYEIDFDKNTISIEYYRKGKYHTKDKKLIKKGTD